ncbi:hypothetical protein VOLCADRAFT_87292 [Volvox carteri f. nagariensis]|uniref:F-box domain-containing protein n=1 Tax=Volvox carteri f. nagariensis TaxID=3068 RepID=D8TKY5_VOLCA|nr:uncharacterized protein VOLCADRAFT_87292 [Volvox carteri f. nagariensis]EFJ51777.1 hypothetical protein VOLCADRAFT_87292 [Volvox carteri f. nagariensis]|eukprot:XP_002947187.1 hypothetical protein VOLCADRAFT_87292 [Volvox carteri f. nagariensis]
MSSLGLAYLLASPQEDFTFLLRRLPAPALAEGILADIMMHLDLRDVLACRLVNKTWSRAAATVIRHVNVPCKAVATTANAAGVGSVDVALRRLHRMWPVASAVTLSGLAAGRALNEELSLQLLANHLSRWRNLKELNLLEMPVTPATTVRLAVQQQQQQQPAAAPPYDRHDDTGATAAPGTRDPSTTAVAAAAAANTAPGEITATSVREYSRSNRSMGGSRGSGGGEGHASSRSPGPWGLACLSCCLGLTRLHVELVPASEGVSSPSSSWRQRQQRWGRWGPQRASRRPDPAQLAAGQAVLLEGLTRLTRLTHLCLKLLEVPDQDMEEDEELAEVEEEGEGSTESELEAVVQTGIEEALVGALWCGGLSADCKGETRTAAGGEDVSSAAVAADAIISPAATTGADDYLLDLEEAGNYGSDLDMDLDLDLGQDSKSRNGRATAGNAGEGSTSEVEVAQVPGFGSCWIPHPALFVRMGPRLRSLRLVGCDLQGGGALTALASVLTCLTSLSLQGRLELTREDLGALSSLRDLQDLSLSGVDLVYGQDDLDDYPQDLMNELYGALQQLRHFQSLKFEVNSRRCIGLHSSWLPVEDVPLSHLRSLSLSLTLDSGHALQILAELTSLTALSLSYLTCPVALYSDDMTALAPLTGLRRFSLRHDPSERDFIISLSGRVVQELAGAWTQLSQLAFSGQIEPDVPGKPSLDCLASWTSLRDLSLTAVPEEQISLAWFRHTTTTAATSSTAFVATDGLGGGSRSWGPGGDDDDNREAAIAAGALDLGVGLGRCLPPGLVRLELSGIRLRGGELLELLAGPMTGLTSLQVLDCGLTPAHLMRTALHSATGNGGCSAAARPFSRQRESSLNQQPQYLVGNHQPQQQGTKEGERGGQEQQNWQPRCPSASSPMTGLSENGFGSVVGDGTGESDRIDRPEDEGGRGAEVNGTGGCGSCGGGDVSCCCWRWRLIRHGVATLGSLRSLEFMLLGLPDDELAAAEVLRPLSVLTGLRYLTLRAPGLQAAATGEVSEPLGCMMQLRCLNLAGPSADSAAARGAEDAARQLPYLKC